MLSLGDDNAALPRQLWSRTGLHRQIQSDLGESRRIRARQRRAMPRLDVRGTTRAAKPPTRPDGFGSTRLPATGISVPNADRTQHGRSRASFRVAFATSGSGYTAIERLGL